MARYSLFFAESAVKPQANKQTNKQTGSSKFCGGPEDLMWAGLQEVI